jgi:hypothetical protein
VPAIAGLSPYSRAYSTIASSCFTRSRYRRGPCSWVPLFTSAHARSRGPFS